MTGVNRREDIISVIKDLDRRMHSVERTTKFDDESDGPPLPPAVNLLFQVHEVKQHIEYRATVKWATVSPNTCQADVDYWVVELQATNKNGTPQDMFDKGTDTPFTYTKNINNKADVTTPHAIYDHITHPQTWYYRARVRIVDKAHRKGPWSAWTTPVQPIDVALPKPPTPTGLHINYNTIDGTRWDRQQAEVVWDEIGDWDVPGDRSVTVTNATEASNDATITTASDHFIIVDDKVEIKGVQPGAYNGTWKVTAVPSDTTFKFRVGATVANLTSTGTVTDTVDHESDVAAYQVRFRRCSSSGSPIGGVRKRHVTAKDDDAATFQSVTFEKGLHKQYYYQASVRSIDRFNRRSDWTNWSTPATPGDANPPPVPIKVRAYDTIGEIGIEWEPPSDPTDSELPHPDVAYFQVQVAYGAQYNKIVRRDIFVNASRRAFKTKHYKTKHWLRVRSMDAAGNKSAWVSRGPVKPLKSGSQKRKGRGAADVEWTNDDGKDTYTGQPNRAYLTSVTAVGLALADAGVDDVGLPNNDGLVEATVKLSKTANRARAGVAFRGQSTSDFMWVDLDKTATQGTIRLRKKDGGTNTSLVSVNATLVEGGEYNLQVILEGNKISVYVEEVLVIDQYTMSGGDYTKYSGFSKYGMVVDRGASTDDGGSRVSDFIYQNADGLDVLLDFFDRADNTTTLGATETGQTWVASNGTWGVAKHRVAGSIIGLGVQRPDLTMTNNNQITNNINNTAGAGDPYEYYTMGTTFKIDRPVKITVIAFTIVSQASPEDFRLYFAIGMELQNQGISRGGVAFKYIQNNDRPDQIMNMRTKYYNPVGTKDLTLYWGFVQNGSTARPVTIYQRRAIVTFSYAPDVEPESDIKWTDDEAFKLLYRGEDADD